MSGPFSPPDATELGALRMALEASNTRVVQLEESFDSAQRAFRIEVKERARFTSEARNFHSKLQQMTVERDRLASAQKETEVLFHTTLRQVDADRAALWSQLQQMTAERDGLLRVEEGRAEYEARVKGAKEKENGMTTSDVTAVARLKVDAHEAVWRTSAKTAVRLFTEPLAIALSKRLGGHPDLTAEKLAGLLRTPEGEAVVAFCLGAAPLLAPQLLVDLRVRRFTHELRVLGLQTVTDRLSAELLAPIMTTFASAMALLPPAAAEEPEEALT